MIRTLIRSDMIYYSHVNEDNRVERELLQQSSCTSVIAVAGSGERIIALLDNLRCEEFHAVDVNEEALFVLELKLEILQYLPVENYFEFCGHQVCSRRQRIEWFGQVKHKLTPSCKMYWEHHISLIEKGMIHSGHFERFLQRVRPIVNQFLGKNFSKILSGHSLHQNKFPGRRWKFIKFLFSQRWMYKAWGNRDVAFVGDQSVIHHIPDALDRIISKGVAASSFITHLVFRGHLRDMKEDDLPPSLQRPVLQSIKGRLNSRTVKVHYHHADLLEFVAGREQLTAGVFYSMSDILSFENQDYLRTLLTKTVYPGNVVVWRTFLRNRIDDNFEGLLRTRYPGLTSHSNSESTGMYQVFAVGADVKNDFINTMSAKYHRKTKED